MRNDEDNLIDWSAFDAPAQRSKPVMGSGLLKGFAVVLFILAAGGCALGGVEFGAALSAMQSDDPLAVYAQAPMAMRAFVLLAVSMATFVPAAFALQMAASPTRAAAPLVLGALGVFVPAAAFALSLMSAAAGDGVEDFRLLAFSVAAIVYTALVVFVCSNASYGSGAHAGGHSKEALWDEKEIWK